MTRRQRLPFTVARLCAVAGLLTLMGVVTVPIVALMVDESISDGWFVLNLFVFAAALSGVGRWFQAAMRLVDRQEMRRIVELGIPVVTTVAVRRGRAL
jgi:hypothetical protein